MKKKASAKKISERTRKQAMEKKIKKALTTSQKSSAKTKKTTAASPVGKTKKPIVKKSTVAAAKKPPAKKRAVAAKKPKTVTVKKQEKTGKAVKKSTPKIQIKAEKVRKKTTEKKEEKLSVITKKKTTAKTAAEKSVKKIRVTAAKEKPVKAKTRKVPEKPGAKKMSPVKTGKVSTIKSAEKPKRTVSTTVKPEKKRQPGKKAQIIRAEVPRQEPSAEKETRQKKNVAPPEPAAEAKNPVAVKRETTFPSEQTTLYPPVPWETFPSEYGENAITIMVVNPFSLFVFWEVRENALKMFKGDLIIRTYDVTAIDIDKAEANSFFDSALSDRIGSCYLDVNPGRQYITDIGILYEGIFVSIARSNAVETPRATPAAEGAFPLPGDETGMRIGY